MRLTEIEAEAKRRQGWRSEPGHNYPTVTIDRDVFFLVTRAVRQLGAVTRTAQGVMDEEVRWTDKATSLNLTLVSVDPDVLELIDETD